MLVGKLGSGQENVGREQQVTELSLQYTGRFSKQNDDIKLLKQGWSGLSVIMEDLFYFILFANNHPL